MGGDAVGPIVVFEGQADAVRVAVVEQVLIQSNLAARPAVQNVLGKLVESLKHVHLHRLANGVLAFDMRQGPTTHRKMLRNHAKVIVPTLVVPHNLTLQMLEGERRYIICQLMLSKDLGWDLRCILLILYIADYHALQNGIRLARMRVRLRQGAIGQRVIPIVKLRNVPPEVLLNCELAARVNPFVTCGSEH